MGANQSGKIDKTFYGEEVNFDHFQILRAIGKGSFGKVCIVQKKDTKQMFAMKYMNKHQCIERDALKNVLREVEILTKLEHPFLVNLWFSFQGVVAYEMLRRERPFDIHSATSIQDVRTMFQNGVDYPVEWSEEIVDLLSKFLHVSPGGRVASLQEIKQIRALLHIDMDKVYNKYYKPAFTPPKDHLNCDPTFELEEMIIETKPLHKKKKRLAKQRSIREVQGAPLAEADCDSPMEDRCQIIPDFRIYNRYHELEKRERERKELAWEHELLTAMNASDPLGLQHQHPKDREHNKSCSRSCPRLNINNSIKNRMENSPRLKKLRSCESATFQSQSAAATTTANYASLENNATTTNEDSEKCISIVKTKDKDKDKNVEICDIGDNLHGLEYIDRTPSPTEHTNHTCT